MFAEYRPDEAPVSGPAGPGGSAGHRCRVAASIAAIEGERDIEVDVADADARCCNQVADPNLYLVVAVVGTEICDSGAPAGSSGSGYPSKQRAGRWYSSG